MFLKLSVPQTESLPPRQTQNTPLMNPHSFILRGGGGGGPQGRWLKPHREPMGIFRFVC